MTSEDYIADAVRSYWKDDGLPQDVVVYFYQKYAFDNAWCWCEEVAFSESDSDYETVTFLNDFCEGETCVKDITIVPLSEVLEHYTKTKLGNKKAVEWDD